ncbi:hypothetical protein [Candidatus Borrarchaeum sp.]|uniref:hypothetical protein n=1 Tax=Candidatus Borrarchaeum sp. TaxID=2846742 RepID=UPI0025808E1B|nr:hypothetical protein [Candidatus Borrarchaeum sp.]
MSNNDNKNDSLIKLQMFRDFRKTWEFVEEVTLENRQDKILTWFDFVSKWIAEWYKLMKFSEEQLGEEINILPKGGNTQLFLRRGIELFLNLTWIQNCVLSGAYHQAIRELRYSLETMIQSYYLDINHPEASLECKLEILKELADLDRPITAGNVIDKSKLDNKKKLKKLYKELSSYVHPSFTEIDSGVTTTMFRPKLFDLCLEFTNKVMNAIFNISKKWNEEMQKYIK